jgi:hypothetical protein
MNAVIQVAPDLVRPNSDTLFEQATLRVINRSKKRL